MAPVTTATTARGRRRRPASAAPATTMQVYARASNPRSPLAGSTRLEPARIATTASPPSARSIS